MFKRGRQNAISGLLFLGTQHLGILSLQSLSFPGPCQPGSEDSSRGLPGSGPLRLACQGSRERGSVDASPWQGCKGLSGTVTEGHSKVGSHPRSPGKPSGLGPCPCCLSWGSAHLGAWLPSTHPPTHPASELTFGWWRRVWPLWGWQGLELSQLWLLW